MAMDGALESPKTRQKGLPEQKATLGQTLYPHVLERVEDRRSLLCPIEKLDETG